VREGLRREVSELYAPYDAVLMPAMGIDRAPASSRGAVGAGSVMWELEAKFTCMWNLTGAPVVTVHVPSRPQDGRWPCRSCQLRGATTWPCAWGLRRGVLVDSAALIWCHLGAAERGLMAWIDA